MASTSVRGHLDLVLLGALAAAPGHGYAVIAAVRAQTGGTIDLAEGLVYPALHRLEDIGWVTSAWIVVGGRRRREYRLTDRGRRALRADAAAWRHFVDAVESVLAAAAVGGVQGRMA